MKTNTGATTSGALTATGAVTTHDTTVTITYAINGKAYSKTAITTGATPTTDHNDGAVFPGLNANQGTVVVWGLNAAGDVKCMMGKIEALDSAGNFKVAPEFPNVKDDVCVIAYQILKAGSTLAAEFNFGTDNWNAAGMTAGVPVNILFGELPHRPQVS
jgi:hypothetical protein